MRCPVGNDGWQATRATAKRNDHRILWRENMSGSTKTGSPIIPTLRYRDANAAIEWLCDAFGFERHLVVPDDRGGIAHAQLVLGNGMIMLGSAREDAFGQLQRPLPGPDAPVHQSAYVVVADVDAHHERAVRAGARVIAKPQDQGYGGRLYSCRDLEGHVWNFGSYDPWRPA
jgi:uncharacterized glyoxalase superfamily protein PhnB